MKKHQHNTHKSSMPTLELDAVAVDRGRFSLHIPYLAVQPGQIACIVGPNGSGKTTLLLTALGLVPHSGTVQITGKPYDGTQPKLKARIGFIPDDPEMLFEELTAREHWALTASMLAQRRVAPEILLRSQAAKLAKAIGFDPPATVAGSYSHGMRKKTQFVMALMGRPPLIVVDELRNGLDPIAVRQAEDLMRIEKSRGAAILAATHDLWWAERFADYVYVVHQGELIAHGTPKQLLTAGETSLEQAFFRLIGMSQ